MKKINHIFLALIGLLMITASCNRPMTYAERLQAEERAINQFVAQNNFVILSRMPSDTVFQPHEFFRDPATGVYFNIVCRGDLTDRIRNGREVHIRFRGLNLFMSNDTILRSNDRDPSPISMTYRGRVTMQNRFLYENAIGGTAVPAFMVPVRYIGNGGRARMIVPFNMGSIWERQVFQAKFFDEIDYDFDWAW